MKSIALFGGSFNPPHPGHFEMACHVYKTLNVDEVWFLYSQNPFKDSSRYASVAQRIEMSLILAKHYPDLPFVACDVEEEIGSHRTYDILTALQKIYPENKFIWVMGADNLAQFHTWGNYEKIIENFPIAVVDRPGYTEVAQKSIASQTYAHLEQKDPKNINIQGSGWCFIKAPRVEMSSTGFLKQIFDGQAKFEGPQQEVADYIANNGLYKAIISNQAPEALEPKI